MNWSESTRRSFLKQFGAAGAMAMAAAKSEGLSLSAAQAAGGQGGTSAADARQAATRAQRMQ